MYPTEGSFKILYSPVNSPLGRVCTDGIKTFPVINGNHHEPPFCHLVAKPVNRNNALVANKESATMCIDDARPVGQCVIIGFVNIEAIGKISRQVFYGARRY